MSVRKDYEDYWKYLGEEATFLEKYRDLDILKRLKNVSRLCGMEYASSHAYNFAFSISRYEHSLATAKLVYKCSKDKSATLAALFHDIATPVFSHVIDYMNRDYLLQESTEKKTYEILNKSPEVKRLLQSDNVDIADVINFKKYSIVDLPRPCLCADRIDNIISDGMTWLNVLSFQDAKEILDDIVIYSNENGALEMGFSSENTALYVKYINDEINKLMHTKKDNYMMLLLANIVKRCIDIGVVDYDELYQIDEPTMVKIIESAISGDDVLHDLWYSFRTIETFPDIDIPNIKDRCVNPLVVGKRLCR